MAGAARAQVQLVFAQSGTAINGYDPVAYFTQGAPVRGKARHALIWKGAEWRFASAENMAAFEANPRAYAPQYGGYCAYSMAQGQIASTEPDAWKIHQGKLYLIHNREFKDIWEQDIPGYISLADAQWPQILSR